MRFRTMQGYPDAVRARAGTATACRSSTRSSRSSGPKLREMSTVEVRKLCFEYADKYVEDPERAVPAAGHPRRMGQSVSDDEAGVRSGHARSLRAVSSRPGWSTSSSSRCRGRWRIKRRWRMRSWNTRTSTTPAFTSNSPLASSADSVGAGADRRVAFLVWTTTPWTLPANLAIAVHPDVRICVRPLHPRRRRHASASSRPIWSRKSSKIATGVERYRDRQDRRPAARLVGAEYQHPFIDRRGKIVAADYVTTTDGTGLVHTAPGHGEDDYETGVKQRPRRLQPRARQWTIR